MEFLLGNVPVVMVRRCRGACLLSSPRHLVSLFTWGVCKRVCAVGFVSHTFGPVTLLLVSCPRYFFFAPVFPASHTAQLGPLICGSHVTIWIFYTFISTIDTVHGHSGWHLPFLGSSEAHDYHHWQGNDNLGVLDVLDTYYGTNTVYNASWRKTLDVNYSSPDYPVDKILNRMAQEPTLPVAAASP